MGCTEVNFSSKLPNCNITLRVFVLMLNTHLHLMINGMLSLHVDCLWYPSQLFFSTNLISHLVASSFVLKEKHLFEQTCISRKTQTNSCSQINIRLKFKLNDVPINPPWGLRWKLKRYQGGSSKAAHWGTSKVSRIPCTPPWAWGWGGVEQATRELLSSSVVVGPINTSINDSINEWFGINYSSNSSPLANWL